MGNTWMNNFPIRDSMYTVGWDNIAVAPGGTSNAFTTMFGVSDPMENPVLAGSHRTPPIINIQSSDQARTAITIPLVNCTADNLGVEHLNVSSFAASGASLDAIDHAIDQLSDFRSRMGAVSNRLEKAKNNVDNTGENIQAAESRIRDVDMAKEMVEYSKENILQQAGQSLLAQAAQINEGVLQLLS